MILVFKPPILVEKNSVLCFVFLQSVQNYFLIGAFVETQNTRGFVVLCICTILNCFCVVCVLYIFVQFCTYENLGPDGVRHQRVTTEENTRKIGIGAISDLESSEADYVHRSFPKFTFFMKKSLVGEIGWNWQDAGKLNKTVVQVGNSSSSFCFDLSNKSWGYQNESCVF